MGVVDIKEQLVCVASIEENVVKKKVWRSGREPASFAEFIGDIAETVPNVGKNLC
jgi:hypothetical protein